MLRELLENTTRFERVANKIPEPLISTRSARDEWSIKENLAHLADIQNLCVGRIKKILSEDNPPIEIYDDERENRQRDHSNEDMSSLREAFLSIRSNLVLGMKELPDSDWLRTGRHPERENFTIEFILNDMLDHERKHFEKIDQIANRIPDLNSAQD